MANETGFLAKKLKGIAEGKTAGKVTGANIKMGGALTDGLNKAPKGMESFLKSGTGNAVGKAAANPLGTLGLGALGAGNLSAFKNNDSNLMQILLGLGGTGAALAMPKLKPLTGMAKAGIGLGSGLAGGGLDALLDGTKNQGPSEEELLMMLMSQQGGQPGMGMPQGNNQRLN